MEKDPQKNIISMLILIVVLLVAIIVSYTTVYVMRKAEANKRAEVNNNLKVAIQNVDNNFWVK